MADAGAPKTQIKSASEHENPGKSFLYKAALVTVFLVLVPLFPSLAPDFFNQTFHARSWELLQLIFVGIAVSYGLFSKKNDEPHKDNHTSKIDNAQSYVSKLLQVSSVFDDESESHTVIEENKFQALNSQYYRGEPVVVVAKENPAVEEKNGVVSQISQKPLLLPVRSLKQRVPNPNEADSSSKRLSASSRKSRNGGLKRLNVDKVEEKEEENVVLRSPIPWRSRSGRMEMRENNDELTSFGVVSPSMEEQELSRVNESRSFRSSRPNASLSSESQSKSGEDVVRKKSFAPPPPAPPPPPSPSFLRKSVLMKSSSSVGHNADSTKKVLTRSVRSVPTEEESSENEMDRVPRRNNTGDKELRFGLENQDLVKSVRTFRPNESMDYEMINFSDKKGPNPNLNPNHNPKEESKKTKEFTGNVLMGDTTESESEAEAEAEAETEADADDDNGGNEEGLDVDKKADEFIAKFREQIRLQRIETIRRLTAQRAAGKTCR